MSNNDESLTPRQVLDRLEEHERGCDKRHADITKNFDKTNRNIRNWVLGGIAFLSLIITILSAFNNGGGNIYINPPQASAAQAQETRPPVKEMKAEQPEQ